MSEWLDTPEGCACVEAGAVAIAEYVGIDADGNDVRSEWYVPHAERVRWYVPHAERVLAAALDVRVDCPSCQGQGWHGDEHRTPCRKCARLGTVPVLYPREEK